jgi:hypothetical protein
MGHKTIAMTARCAHLAPTHKLKALETLARPRPVSIQSGYQRQKPCKAKKFMGNPNDIAVRNKTAWEGSGGPY